MLPASRAARPLVPVLLAALLALACGPSKKVLTSAEETKLGELRQEYLSLTTEIAAVRAESLQYSGGTMRALLDVRLEVLRSTQALVEGRVQALEAGSALTVVVEAAKPDPSREQELDGEIEVVRGKIREGRDEVAAFGNEIGARRLLGVATDEETLALLQQQRLIAKYGLHLPPLAKVYASAPDCAPTLSASPTSEGASTSDLQPEPQPAAPAPAAAPPPPTSQVFEITGVDGRVTEGSSTYSRFAWKMSVRNPNDRALTLDATIQFLDQDGFVVDQDSASGLLLGARQEQTFTGFKLISAASAARIRQIKPDVKAR